MNRTRTAVAAWAEVLSGRKRRLWAQGELAALDGGYRQAVEFRHSFPQVPEPLGHIILYNKS